MFDFITIGSATLDVFVETEDARIVSVASPSNKSEFMAFPYGSKLELENFAFEIGGGALNTAFNFANLGFKTSPIIKIGKDPMAIGIMSKISQYNLDKSNIVESPNEKSGFSVILTSFQGDRTVLAHRGTNATLKENEVNFDAIKNAKWLYLAPLNGDSTKILDKIAFFAQENDVNLSINLGTTSIKKHKDKLPAILETAEIVVMNREEAEMYTGIMVRPDNSKESFSKELIHPDIKEILNKIHIMGEGIVVVTDGGRGVYAYDGKKFYQAESFPAKVVSTLGSGDAFASTFTATMYKTDWDVEKSLLYASVNAASVVEHFGAQSGFLTFEEIEAKIKTHPEFKINIME